MTQTLESYIQTKANFIADYLFSNSLSPFNGGKSITTPLLGKVVGFIFQKTPHWTPRWTPQ